MTEMERVCPRYHHAVELIGRRWTGAIIVLLLQGYSRFHELSAHIPEMSDRMLSERLKELEAEGILSRSVHPETPVRIEYRLTSKGLALREPIEAIQAWASSWLHQDGTAAQETDGGEQPAAG